MATRISDSIRERASRASTRCRHSPASNAGAAPSIARRTTQARFEPEGNRARLRGYLNEFGAAGEAPLLGRHIDEEAVFQCTTCGGCEFGVPGGDSASAADRRPAARRGEHGGVGERARRQAVPQPGAPRQPARLRAGRTAAVHREKRIAVFRWLAGILPLARLHGRLRSAGQGNRAGAGPPAAPCRRHLRRAAQGEMHRRSGAPPGQRSGGGAVGGIQYRNAARGQGRPHGLHLPALRAHHRHRLAANTAPRSTSCITANCWQRLGARLPAAQASAGKVVFHDPCYLGRYRNSLRRAAQRLAALRGGGRSAARARTFLLLRRRWRADVPRRGKGHARQPRARRRN
jgi:hypothetical protein